MDKYYPKKFITQQYVIKQSKIFAIILTYTKIMLKLAIE